jgi:hypothetical protein
LPKLDPDKVAAEIQSMQQELKNLQNALAELLDAMITEEKPGPKKIKKLNSLKKRALTEQETTIKESPITLKVRGTPLKTKQRKVAEESAIKKKPKTVKS